MKKDARLKHLTDEFPELIHYLQVLKALQIQSIKQMGFGDYSQRATGKKVSVPLRTSCSNSDYST
jgi:hypothetical protein